MTTKLMEQLIQKASALPADLQDLAAAQWLAELDDEKRWDESFAKSADLIDTMAENALREHRAGKTVAKGFDEL